MLGLCLCRLEIDLINVADVRLFTFWWTGVSRADYNPNDWFGVDPSMRDAHAIFNQAFVGTFPRLLYTNPFTNYTDAGIGIGSQITGTGETTWNDAQIRAAIIAGANAVGLTGDESNLRVSAKTINELQQGQNLQLPETTVDYWRTQDAYDSVFGDNGGAKKGASYALWIALGLGAVLIMTRR